MCKTSEYIMILCGVFKDSYHPLTRAAFWKLYHKYNDSVEELIHSEEETVQELLKRSASVSFALEEMAQKGIRITTFADDDFPERLLKKLGDFCPPLLYVCGNQELNRMKTVGYVGSRSIDERDIGWTEARIADNLRDGYGVVTGGAKGIDSIALRYALDHDGRAIVYLPDNMGRMIQDSYLRQKILEERLLVYSHISPYAEKTRNSFVSSAMERNKFIYAQSVATVVVRSDLNKGGTWKGATETLKHKWTYVYVWDHNQYPGNQKLIELGAIPLSDNGTSVHQTEEKAVEETKPEPEAEQMSIFDMM